MNTLYRTNLLLFVIYYYLLFLRYYYYSNYYSNYYIIIIINIILSYPNPTSRARNNDATPPDYHCRVTHRVTLSSLVLPFFFSLCLLNHVIPDTHTPSPSYRLYVRGSLTGLPQRGKENEASKEKGIEREIARMCLYVWTCERTFRSRAIVCSVHASRVLGSAPHPQPNSNVLYIFCVHVLLVTASVYVFSSR